MEQRCRPLKQRIIISLIWAVITMLVIGIVKIYPTTEVFLTFAGLVFVLSFGILAFLDKPIKKN